MQLATIVHESRRCNSPEALWAKTAIIFKEMGFPYFSYQYANNFGNNSVQHSLLVSHNYPEDWARFYEEQRAADYDPLIRFSKHWSRPFKWLDAPELLQLNAEQSQYMLNLVRADFGNGITIPVFAAQDRQGFFALGGKPREFDCNEDQQDELRLVCQQIHFRYCELAYMEKDVTILLSPREKEVLRWVSRGMSNASIANILNISGHTVDAHLRRSFNKLGVSDRVTATLRAYKLGMLAP